jgi:hypothetical protein
METRTQMLVDRWNADETRWRRFEEFRIAVRLESTYRALSDEEIDLWAWLEATKYDDPLDCIGVGAARST